MVDKELEKIRKQNKEIAEQWRKEVEVKAKKIAYFLGAVRGLQTAIKVKDNDMPSDDDLQKIAMFLAESIYPNPLNKLFPSSQS